MARKKKVKIENCEVCAQEVCECDKDCELCKISGECICEKADLEPVAEVVEQPAPEIAPEPSNSPAVEIPDHVCADVACCIQKAPEALPEPPQSNAGQGHWDQKYNMARRSKSPAARKYIPVHRQR